MAKRKHNRQTVAGVSGAADTPGIITVSGNIPRPGQSAPGVVVLTAPRRFGIDIADYTAAVRQAESVDLPSRTRLYDLYADILMDSHLSSVVDKRINAVLATPVAFMRADGTPDDAVNGQIAAPWFNRLVRDILEARLYGFSLMQFFRVGEWVDYHLIPRKHACPVRQIIKRNQFDQSGPAWEEYPGLLFVGDPQDLGLLAKAAPWVIYKRNTTGDWSQFSEVFGMPIQEYTYDSDDDESRQRAIADARSTGALATFIHGKDTTLNLLEAGNKTGSADVYERLIERCNSEISKLILGNTLTTEASETGTQALGTVHKRVEDLIADADRNFLLQVLNYDLIDILEECGLHVAGGKFYYPERKIIDDTTKANILVQLSSAFGLPVSDDYLYEAFGIDKPEDYDVIKAQEQERRAAMAAISRLDEPDNDAHDDGDTPPDDGDTPDKRQSKKMCNRADALSSLLSFFGRAPRDGAKSDW